MSKSIQQISKFMTTIPIALESTSKLSEAHALMRQLGVRHVPIVDDGDLVGLLSLSDLHLIETLKDVDPTDVQIKDAMSRKPYQVPPEMPLDQVADDMAERKIGSAVIVDSGRVVGMFTTTDALRALADLARERAHRETHR